MTATILIVEDEVDLRELVRYNLEAEGFRVSMAESGDEAVERIRDGVPDLILLDWMLPGLSGIELCRRWRSREETARTPIIMITARGEEEERVRGLATGADDYVVKPFSIPELQARIQALLRRSSPQLVSNVLKAALDAYAARNSQAAVEVCGRDDEVDAMYNSLFRELLTYMMEDPRNITQCTHLLFCTKSLERVGDHATNVAEAAYYLVTGRHLAADEQVRQQQA